MRRAFAAVVGTVFGLVLLLGYKSSGAHPAPRPAVAAGPAPATSPSDQSTQPTTPPTSAAASGPPGPTTTAAPGGTRTVNGPDVPNQFGDVQVALVLQGTKIVDVKALVLPTDRARSAEISSIAGPMLREQVLAAQSANIDGVSGASYTSESYAQSVQGALDQARK